MLRGLSNFFDKRRNRREEREEQERYKHAASRRKRQTNQSSFAPAPPIAPSKPSAVEPPRAKPPTAPVTSNPLFVSSVTVPASSASFNQPAVLPAPAAAHPRRDSSDSSRSLSADEVCDDSASDSNRRASSSIEKKSAMEKLLRDFGLDPYSEMLCEAGFDTPFKMARMTDTDISGLKMKLIHKKKLTKVLTFLAENPPKPDGAANGGNSPNNNRSSFTPEKTAAAANTNNGASEKRQALPSRVDKAAAMAAAATTPSPPKAGAPKPLKTAASAASSAASPPASPRAGTLVPPKTQPPKTAEPAAPSPAAAAPVPAPAAPAPAPAAAIHRVSRLIAECEEHARVVVGSITTKSQELDAAKAELSAANLAQAELEAQLAKAAEEREAEHDKLDTALESGVVESTTLAEKEKALKADVSELTEQDQDLDDQLMIDEESLQAKSDDISALLQKNEDITEEKAALKLLIEETKRTLAEKQYRAKVAARQERVFKASHAVSGATKYAGARYTMTRSKVA